MKWRKEDNGNKPRVLGPASEKLLCTIAAHDTGQGVQFKHRPGNRLELVGTNYRVNLRTFHPFYDEYMGDHPTNGPLADETSAEGGTYAHITAAGRAWIEAADAGEVEAPARSRKPVRPAVTPPSAELFLSVMAEQVEGEARRLTDVTNRLRAQGHDDLAKAAWAAREVTHDLFSRIEKELRRTAREQREAAG